MAVAGNKNQAHKVFSFIGMSRALNSTPSMEAKYRHRYRVGGRTDRRECKFFGGKAKKGIRIMLDTELVTVLLFSVAKLAQNGF